MMRQLGLFILLSLFSPCLFAGQVAKVKGSSALVTMGGESTLPGDTFFAVEGGKKKAIIRIVKVKGDKAIAKIVKGRAAPGMSLQRAASGGNSSKAASHRSSKGSSSSGSFGNGRAYWGAMLGLGQDSMSVQVNNFAPPHDVRGTVALSGMGFSAKGLFDYELFDQVWFRGLSGLEQFNASGSANCGVNNAEACTAKIMYLTLDFIAPGAAQALAYSSP